MSKYARQLDLITPEELLFPIHIIGCGGIGSWTTLMLAKMGCQNITVYDDDVVEEHNVASQFFKDTDLGEYKTIALYKNVLEQTGIHIKCQKNEVEESMDNGVVILAIDSMEERIRLEQIYKDKNLLIIDGRMGGLQLEIYVRQACHYKDTLCEPIQVDKDSCTGKAISFNCATIGSWIANLIRLYSKGKLKESNILFDFENMILVSEVPQQSQNN